MKRNMNDCIRLTEMKARGKRAQAPIHAPREKKHPSPVETVFSSIIHDGFLAFIPYAYFTTHICVEQLEQMKRKTEA